MVGGVAAKAHTGFEPLPPGLTRPATGRQGSTESPDYRGFLLHRGDAVRHAPTARDVGVAPGPVQNLSSEAPPTPRPVQGSLLDTGERPVGPVPSSLVIGTNAPLIASIAPLYLTGSVLDVTYGKGLWWRLFTPNPFAYHDLAVDGVDFRSLPHPNGSWDAVCFDPPYLPVRVPATSTGNGVRHRGAYGLTVRRTRSELDALIADGLAECSRVARRWVLAKCCDYAENLTTALRLGHVTTIVAGEAVGLRVHDLLVLGGGTGPSNTQIRTIRRARRAHSYLVVFRKPGRKAAGGKAGAR